MTARPLRPAGPKRGRIAVLVVDDSAVVRHVLTTVLENEGDMDVVVAGDPLIAMDKMKRVRPDVIVLDLEMPRMDGLTFLRVIMQTDPIPVVICSSHTGKGTNTALNALAEGAVDLVTKPKLGVRQFLHESAVALVQAVRGAARAKVKARYPRPPLAAPKLTADVILPPPSKRGSAVRTDQLIAVGASTGGTEALKVLLEAMPTDAPGIVVVQHMPETFTKAFANRLNETCAIDVKEAQDGDELLAGRALIAAGNFHLVVGRSGSRYSVRVMDGPLVSRHRPSVNVLFRSVAEVAGPNAVAVIMTGMGDDGAQGMEELKRAGAATLAQDEASCVVFGMPREAIMRGVVDEVVPLDRLASTILQRAVERREMRSA